MIMGLGATSATAPPASPTAWQSFTAGLKQWESPSAALATAGTLVSNPGTAFSGSTLPYTLGVFAVPIALIALITGMGGKRH